MNWKAKGLAGALIASTALLAAPSVQAAEAIEDFSGGEAYESYAGTQNGTTIGFAFNLADAINVTALGWYAVDEVTVAPHEVGIFTLDGTLLVSTVVNPGVGDMTGFVFQDIGNFALAAGDYLIGGLDTGEDGDRYIHFADTVTTASGVTFLGAARSESGSGFAAPLIRTQDIGRFGPNFRFGVAAVPEPGTWLMLLLGFGLLGHAMRARKSQTAARVNFAF